MLYRRIGSILSSIAINLRGQEWHGQLMARRYLQSLIKWNGLALDASYGVALHQPPTGKFS